MSENFNEEFKTKQFKEYLDAELISAPEEIVNIMHIIRMSINNSQSLDRSRTKMRILTILEEYEGNGLITTDGSFRSILSGLDVYRNNQPLFEEPDIELLIRSTAKFVEEYNKKNTPPSPPPPSQGIYIERYENNSFNATESTFSAPVSTGKGNKSKGSFNQNKEKKENWFSKHFWELIIAVAATVIGAIIVKNMYP